MTLHDLMVTATGLVFLAAGVFNGMTFQLLGRAYENKLSVPFWLRLPFVLIGLVLSGRGVSLIFPGPALRVDQMSPWVPGTALAVLVLSGIILDFVLRERAPPPLVERFLRLALRRGIAPETVAALAMDLPTASYRLGGRINRCGRKTRLIVMGLASVAILCVVVLLATARIQTN